MTYLIRASLPWFLVAIYAITLIGAYGHYLGHQNFVMGDWLINYQGGFVRRGLFGEMALFLSDLTSLNPGQILLLFHALFYTLYFYFSWQLLENRQDILLFGLLIFSPFIFTFQVNDLGGGYRKEIVYFAVFSFLVWRSYLGKRSFKIAFIGVLALYPLIILSHEMMAVFLPYLVAAYIYRQERITSKEFTWLGLLILPSILAFCAASVANQLPETAVNEIFSSLEKRNYVLSCGAIAWLDKDAFHAFETVVEEIRTRHYLYYLLPAFLAGIGFIPLTGHIKDLIKNNIVVLLVGTSLIGTLCLMLVSKDWGRLIYMHAVSWFLLCLLVTQPAKNRHTEGFIAEKVTRLPLVVLLVIGLLYATGWHINHVGSPIYASVLKDHRNANLFAIHRLKKHLQNNMNLENPGQRSCPRLRAVDTPGADS